MEEVTETGAGCVVESGRAAAGETEGAPVSGAAEVTSRSAHQKANPARIFKTISVIKTMRIIWRLSAGRVDHPSSASIASALLNNYGEPMTPEYGATRRREQSASRRPWVGDLQGHDIDVGVAGLSVFTEAKPIGTAI
jgi:hypothetical protein